MAEYETLKGASKTNKVQAMRQIISLGFLLLALMFTASRLQAQSGRTRSVQSTKPTNSSSQTPPDSASDDLDNQPARNVSINGQVEIIEGDVLRVDTALVTVPVSVMDRSGKYVPNLQRRDFHVFENGVEQ